MKILIYNILWLLICSPAVLFAWSPIELVEHVRTIEKEFELSAGGTAGVEHRYGNVEFLNTNDRKLRYEVTIKVMTGSEKKAEETFDRIKIDFSESNTAVTATTTKVQNDRSWWGSIWGNNGESYEVNYKVYVPGNLHIYVNNKYGDAFVPDRDGDVTAIIKYGDIHMGNVGGYLDLTLGYTDNKAIIGNVKKLDLGISYSELKAGDVEQGYIKSKYSELRIQHAGNLDVTSKYDEYHIESVSTIKNRGKYDDLEIVKLDKIDIQTKYTDLELGDLSQTAVFDLEYGDLRIDQLTDSFTSLELETRYTDVKLRMVYPFTLDLESRYTDIDLPRDREVVSKDDEGNDYDLVAHFKKSARRAAKLVADMKYGSFRIRD